MSDQKKKPNDRRSFLLKTLPFALPLGGMKLTFEPEAKGQESAALVPMFKEFMEHYKSFQTTFKEVQSTVGSYYNAYDHVKRAYDFAVRQLEREKSRFNSFLGMNSVETFLDAELPNLSAGVSSVMNIYNQAIYPFEKTEKLLEKQFPSSKGGEPSPKTAKYHAARESRARNSLGKMASMNRLERTKALKKEIFQYSKTEAKNEKGAGELFEKQSAHLKLDTLQNIDETLLRMEELMIRMDENLNNVKPKPKRFDKEQWVAVLKSFRRGGGTLTEVG